MPSEKEFILTFGCLIGTSGRTGRVNISGTNMALVKDTFNCVHRGKIVAKGKGEIDMYFVG